MKIRMIEQRSGGRYDGRAWPAVGEDFDVPDDEGAGLCAQGSAIPVAQPDATVEVRGAESPADAPETTGSAKGAGTAGKRSSKASGRGQG